jgi:hypothetical protein
MSHAPSQRRSPLRSRPVGPTCRGGASSVLRLSQPSLPRMPAGADVEAWLERTLGLMARSDTDWAPEEQGASMITRLQPSREMHAR